MRPRVCYAAMALFLFVLTGSVLHAAESGWQEALASMPVASPTPELNRTNCISIMLSAFQSNNLVKALVFMPGATDEFYLFRRARAIVTNDSLTLLDLVGALTNQTFIRADFQRPFLILHTDEDPLRPENSLEDPATAVRLSNHVRVARLNCNDWDWDALQPVLKRSLKIALRPWRYSFDSWHFYRHSFAAWDVTGLQALELAALAGKSKFVVQRREVRFKVDTRAHEPPKFDAHLH
jgi:hypothetical protein